MQLTQYKSIFFGKIDIKIDYKNIFFVFLRNFAIVNIINEKTYINCYHEKTRLHF